MSYTTVRLTSLGAGRGAPRPIPLLETASGGRALCSTPGLDGVPNVCRIQKPRYYAAMNERYAAHNATPREMSVSQTTRR